MADLPKRVWSGKKQVYSGKKPVWVKDGKLGVYDPNFEEVTSGQYYSPNRWGNVSSDAELQIYDDKDSLNPTDIGTFEDGLESTYQFVDYDSTVLKSGKVKDGETPVAPTDPTREHYTFTGWNPTVGPINKNTTYSAVYAIDTFTVNIGVNNPDYGDVSMPSLGSVPYGTAISASDNVLTIGETTITATASEGYQFSSWGTLPATVTEDLTITASFELVNYTVTIGVSPSGAGTVDTQQVTVASGTAISSNNNVLTIGSNTITATAGSGYAFSSWGTLPATVTENLTITATFEASVSQIKLLDNRSSFNGINIGNGHSYYAGSNIEIYNSNGELVTNTGDTGDTTAYDGLAPSAELEAGTSSVQLCFNSDNIIVEVAVADSNGDILSNSGFGNLGSTIDDVKAGILSNDIISDGDGHNITWYPGTFTATGNLYGMETTFTTIKGTLSIQSTGTLYTSFTILAEGIGGSISNYIRVDNGANAPIGFNIMTDYQPMD